MHFGHNILLRCRMGSSPSKGGTINIVKQGTEENSTTTTTMMRMATESGVSSTKFNYANNDTNQSTNEPQQNRPTAESEFNEDWDDDVGSAMTKLKEELDELLGIPPTEMNFKTNARVPEPLQYPGEKSSPARQSNQDLGKGNTWKIPDELVETELNARHARILTKMKELMMACEDEEIDASPWIQSMCSDPQDVTEPKSFQLKEDTSRFDPKKFKEANKYKKRMELENSPSSSTNRTGPGETPAVSSVVAKPPSRSQLSYNSSEEALMASIETEYS